MKGLRLFSVFSWLFHQHVWVHCVALSPSCVLLCCEGLERLRQGQTTLLMLNRWSNLRGSGLALYDRTDEAQQPCLDRTMEKNRKDKGVKSWLYTVFLPLPSFPVTSLKSTFNKKPQLRNIASYLVKLGIFFNNITFIDCQLFLARWKYWDLYGLHFSMIKWNL